MEAAAAFKSNACSVAASIKSDKCLSGAYTHLDGKIIKNKTLRCLWRIGMPVAEIKANGAENDALLEGDFMQRNGLMTIEDPKALPPDIVMRCYACNKLQATHVCRYQVDELLVQVCLCDECMKMDTRDLIKNTIGIEEASLAAVQDHLT